MDEKHKQELIAKKVEDAIKVAKEAFEKFDHDRIAVAYTGGKDSTLCLYIVKEACKQLNIPIPRCFCINEGDMFQEVVDFIAKIKEEWNVPEMLYIHNDDVSKAAGGKLGAMVKVADLNERNRKEVERLGYDEDEFPYEPESFVGNHLMKTATLNAFLWDLKIQGFFEGIRWDEQAARSNEQYFSPREGNDFNPEHYRICPILHFTERDVWDAHFQFDIPACPLYKEGYRSLGAKITTGKVTDTPAWEQDLEHTDERGGRRQDKEGLMKKLRDLGYM